MASRAWRKVGLAGREVHAVGHQLEDELVAGGEAVFVDEVGAGVPKRGAPDFALVMDFGREYWR